MWPFSSAFWSSFICRLLLDLDPYGGNSSDLFPLVDRQVAQNLAPKLAVILRHLVKRGSFLACGRSANVLPVSKGSASLNVWELRPISTMPVLSKVFEKIMAGKLSFLESNSMLFFQFLYHRGLATCDALPTLSHCLYVALNRSWREGLFSYTSQQHLIGLVHAVCCISCDV